MEIKAVKFRRDGFYSQPFAFGGEEGPDKFDPQIRYRGSLQNYLIDTGDEVILVDTGIPAGTPEEVPDENTAIYTGKDISTYMEAFEAQHKYYFSRMPEFVLETESAEPEDALPVTE